MSSARTCDSSSTSARPWCITPETLLARGWADTDNADPAYVWVTMRRLRQKLEADPNHPRHLLTMRGVGYRLVGAGDGEVEPATTPGEAG